MAILDLHAHLGGSVPFHNLFEIGKMGGHRIGSYSAFLEKYAGPIGGPEDYFSRYEIIEPIQSSPSAVNRSVWYSLIHAYTQLDHQGTEIRFNPCFRNRSDNLDIDFIIIEAINGMRDAQDIYGMGAGIILCLDHRLPLKANEAIVSKAKKYKDRGIVGLDLAGPEFLIKDFDYFYDLCRLMSDSGMKYTIHFGETIHTEGRIPELLGICCPNRIGHAISSLYNEKDLEAIKEWSDGKESRCIEFCPKSNIVTGASLGISGKGSTIEFLSKRAIEVWYKNGIRFSVGTDAPALLQTSVKSQMKSFSKAIEKGVIKFIDNSSKNCSFLYTD